MLKMKLVLPGKRCALYWMLASTMLLVPSKGNVLSGNRVIGLVPVLIDAVSEDKTER